MSSETSTCPSCGQTFLVRVAVLLPNNLKLHFSVRNKIVCRACYISKFQALCSGGQS